MAFAFDDDDDNKDKAAKRTKADFLMNYLNIRYPKHEFKDFLYVAVKKQEMHFVKDGKFIKTYKVSTGKKGIGYIEGSEKTPCGLLKIRTKVGDNLPIGAIIRGSKYTGKIAEIERDSVCTGLDYVTTRALRLSGLEEGINKGGKKDTYARGIFIHGTPDEGLIGTPVSHGCIRMLNADVAELYDQVDKNTYVIILNN